MMSLIGYDLAGLLGTDRRVTPLELFKLLRASFFEIFPITPSIQSSGSFFSSHTVTKSYQRTCAANSGSSLNRSALRHSCPGAFPFLRYLMAAIFSYFSGGAVLTPWSVSRSCTSVSFVGGGLLRTALKFSTRLASYSVSVVSSLPYLSAIGVSVVPRYC